MYVLHFRRDQRIPAGLQQQCHSRFRDLSVPKTIILFVPKPLACLEMRPPFRQEEGSSTADINEFLGEIVSYVCLLWITYVYTELFLCSVTKIIEECNSFSNLLNYFIQWCNF
jgi:hypothetical protein